MAVANPRRARAPPSGPLTPVATVSYGSAIRPPRRSPPRRFRAKCTCISWMLMRCSRKANGRRRHPVCPDWRWRGSSGGSVASRVYQIDCRRFSCDVGVAQRHERLRV